MIGEPCLRLFLVFSYGLGLVLCCGGAAETVMAYVFGWSACVVGFAMNFYRYSAPRAYARGDDHLDV